MPDKPLAQTLGEFVANLRFEDLPPNVVGRITSGSLVQTLPKNSVIFSEGEHPEFCHVILDNVRTPRRALCAS